MKLSNLTLTDIKDAVLAAPSSYTAITPALSYSVLDLFDRQVALHPQKLACIGRHQSLNYIRLEQRANQIAHYLIGLGIHSQDRIALWFKRSPDILVALLGVLKAGGCYVPLDPDYPLIYIQQIIADARPELVLCGEDMDALHSPVPVLRLNDAAITLQPETPVTHALHPAQLAYIMYTSGSTARPKGVMVPHQQLLNCLQALWRRVPFSDNEVIAQKTSIAFAISVKEMLSGLLAGVPQVCIDEGTVRDISLFVHEIESRQVTRLYTFPSQLSALLDYIADTPQLLSSLCHVFISIEPCPIELLHRLKMILPDSTAWYIYGCTEINDIACCAPDEQQSNSGFSPVGRPIDNTRIYVLDEQLRPLPAGIMGQVYIESMGVAHGYWQQAGLTATRFIANPYGSPGSRLYKTGDMARLTDDGILELLGRQDHEVKIRGYRVDVRQVEKALTDHAQITETTVIGWPKNSATPELLAYVVPHYDTLDIVTLREYLQERLPTYMIPTHFQLLSALPRLPNGKLDILNLPEPQITDNSTAYAEPCSGIEMDLARIWGELLAPVREKSIRVGRNDNFFSLGGHSLLATQLFSRIRQYFNVEVPVNTLFESPVLKDFATVVKNNLGDLNKHTKSSFIIPLSLRSQGRAIYCIHPIGGQVNCYIDLAAILGNFAKVYSLQYDSSHSFRNLQTLVSHYCDAILSGPIGAPYRFLGWSSGGILALAIAEEFQRRDMTVDYIGLLDSNLIPIQAREPRQLTFVAALNTLATLNKRAFTQQQVNEARQLLFENCDDAHVFDYTTHKQSLDKLLKRLGMSLENHMWQPLMDQLRITRYHLQLLAGYKPSNLNANTHLYQAASSINVSYTDMSKPRVDDETLPDIISYLHLSKLRKVETDHYNMLEGEPLRKIVKIIEQDIRVYNR